MESALAIAQGQMPAPAPVNSDDDDAYVAKLVTYFEDAEEASDGARKQSEQCRDYYDSKQLTSAEKAELKKRGQPDIVINRVQPKIDYILGFEASNRTDPRAFPRNPTDEDAAGAATDALRYVKDSTDLDQKLSGVWENELIEGFGGIELTYNEEVGEIEVKEWHWDRLFYDPHSRKHDFSDARYLGGVIWMDAEEAKEQWPHAAEAIDLTLSTETADRTYDDKPLWKKWSSGKSRKRVRICQMYHKEAGQWKWCIFTKGGKIDGGAVNFVDQKGMSWCPLMLQSAYVDRDNNRYGLVKIMIGPQDEINKRRSKALHILNSKLIIAERGAVDDIDLARAEMVKPDGYVEKNPGFEMEVRDEIPNLTGHLNLLQEAKNEIDLIGPNAAMLGKNGTGDASGRAILANQQGGQTELSRLLDRHRHLKRRVYEGIWNLIRQYKDSEWWVRVTDDEKNVKFVGFNRPVTMAEDLQKQLIERGAAPEEAHLMLQQAMQDPFKAQELQQVVRMENVPADMHMDITLEEVPDVANLAAEQFTGLVDLARAGVTFPPKTYIKASSLRNKQELIAELEDSQANPQAEAMQQAGAQAQLQKLMAEIENLKAKTAETLVKADVAAAPLNQITIPAQGDASGQMPQAMTQEPQPMPGQPPGF